MADDELLAFLAARDAPYCFRCLAMAFPAVHVQPQVEAALRGGRANYHWGGPMRDLHANDDGRGVRA